MQISREWTAAERLAIIVRLLPDMQADIYRGTYSVPGRPNVTSLLHIALEPPEVLETIRDYVERL